jgi:hypothetical protein
LAFARRELNTLEQKGEMVNQGFHDVEREKATRLAALLLRLQYQASRGKPTAVLALVNTMFGGTFIWITVCSWPCSDVRCLLAREK